MLAWLVTRDQAEADTTSVGFGVGGMVRRLPPGARAETVQHQPIYVGAGESEREQRYQNRTVTNRAGTGRFNLV